MRPPLLFSLFAALCAPGCDFLKDFHECAAVPPASLAALPSRLSETGLWTDPAIEALGPDVSAYSPRFELWSDGARKRRWILLPGGTRIDTAHMDFWQFPAGTQLWKEFAFDGRKVETRLLKKLGPGPDEWVAASYAWNEAQTEATLAVDGVTNALGTTHAIPAANQCWGCHGGTPSHVLGFSGIQLAHDAAPGEIGLEWLVQEGRLTVPPGSVPRVPGNATERAALGYLHANCGHCHNADRPTFEGDRCYDPLRSFDLLLRVDDLATVNDTTVYRTAVGNILTPGKPDSGELMDRITRTSANGGMPPLAKDVVHEEGVALLKKWISELPRD